MNPHCAAEHAVVTWTCMNHDVVIIPIEHLITESVLAPVDLQSDHVEFQCVVKPPGNLNMKLSIPYA